MDTSYQAAADITVLPTHFPVPGMGFLPINAFVIYATEPILVDTGIGIDSNDFMSALELVIDPPDLKWIWLTHDDSDHAGNIQQVLETAPNARVVANAVTLIRMSASWQVPMDQVYCLNAGESISVGDRKLTAIRPPLFDNPATIGLYDDKSDALFSADCFGAFLPSADLCLDDMSDETLSKAMILWATADSPWVHLMERSKYRQQLDQIHEVSPRTILSSHLPPTYDKTEQFLELMATVPDAEPFLAPNQAALEQLMAQAHSAVA